MTPGGAGAAFPILVLLLLSLLVISAWLVSGHGSRKQRYIIGGIQLLLALALLFGLFFSSAESIRVFSILALFLLSISMLATPSIYKRAIKKTNT